MKLRDFALGLSLCGLSLLGSSQGVAQAPSLETLQVTGNRIEAPVANLMGSSSTLDQSTLELINHRHIQQSLSRVAGVNVARGNGQEYLPAVRSPVLTGAGGCGSVLSAVDSVPLRAAGFCNINELFEAYSERAQRIEVLRGPGTALYGSNAMHGVINVITRSALAAEDNRAALELGPDDYRRMDLSLTRQQLDQQGVAIDLTSSHSGGYRDDSGYDQQKLLIRHDYQDDKLALATTFAVTNLNQETAGYIEGEDAYKDAHLRRDNPNPEAYRDAFSARLAMQIRWVKSESEQLQLIPYWRHTKMDFLQHFLPGDPLEQNGQSSVGLLSGHYWQVSEHLHWVNGIDLEWTDAYLKQRQDGPTEGSPFLQATIPQGLHYDYQVSARLIAPYTQLEWQFAERWKLQLGLRYESMTYDYDNRMLAGRTADDGTPCAMGGCRYSRPADRRDRFENLSPKLGVSYQWHPQHRGFLNIAHGYRAPQATELYRLQRDQSEATLDSESLLSAELGFSGEQDQFRYQVALFRMKKQNVIFRDSDFYNVADGETAHQGVEWNLHYAFNDQWGVAITGSYAKHTYRDQRQLEGLIEGNEIDSAPRQFGSVRLAWQPTPSVETELEWVYQGRYYTDPENAHRYAGHNLLHWRGRVQLNPSWQLSARLTNITNERYAERADYTSFSGDRYFPGEPRALYVGVEVSW